VATGSRMNWLYLYWALADAVKRHGLLRGGAKLQQPVPEEEAYTIIEREYRIEQERITAVLLGAACVEAIANLYLAKKAPDQFADLERANFVEKWRTIPGRFLNGYSFPRGTELDHDLKHIETLRNQFVHMKPALEGPGGEITEFAGRRRFVPNEAAAFVSRCGTLPIRLLRHLSNFDPEQASEILVILETNRRTEP
jgi:hypothetical protein